MQHDGLGRDVLAVVAPARRVEHHAARRIELGLAVGEHGLHELELGDGLAELLALHRVAQASRSMRSATPTQTAAMWMRPLSSTFIAVLKPRPSLPPMSWPAGTRQFVEDHVAGVGAALAHLACRACRA